MNNRPSVLFLGKKRWSALGLRHLVRTGWDVRAVVCREPEYEYDRSGGTLKEEAQSRGIPALSPEGLRSLLTAARPGRRWPVLENLDFVVSYLFWKRVGPQILRLPRRGAINFHPAPLPELRGVGGYNMAILEGNRSYGVSAHYMTEALDRGDILQVRRFRIAPEAETALSLERRSMQEMLVLFRDVMDGLRTGKRLPRRRQGKGRYIDWGEFERTRRIRPTDSLEVVNRKCRAFFFPPRGGAAIKLGGKEFTVINESILKQLGDLMHESGKPRRRRGSPT